MPNISFQNSPCETVSHFSLNLILSPAFITGTVIHFSFKTKTSREPMFVRVNAESHRR